MYHDARSHERQTDYSVFQKQHVNGTKAGQYHASHKTHQEYPEHFGDS